MHTFHSSHLLLDEAFPITLSLLRGSVFHYSFLSGASMCRIRTCLFEHQRSSCIRRAVMAGKRCVIIGIRLILALYCELGTGRMLSHCSRRLLFVQHSALLQGKGWSRGLFRFLRLQEPSLNSTLHVLVFISLSHTDQDQHFCS